MFILSKHELLLLVHYLVITVHYTVIDQFMNYYYLYMDW